MENYEKKYIWADAILFFVFLASIGFAIASLCTGCLKITINDESGTITFKELAYDTSYTASHFKASFALIITAIALSLLVVIMRILSIVTNNDLFRIIMVVALGVCFLCVVISGILLLVSGNTEFVKSLKEIGAHIGVGVAFWFQLASAFCLAVFSIGSHFVDIAAGRVEVWE